MIYMHYQFQNCLYGERRDFSRQRTLRRSPFLVPRNFSSPVPHGRKTRHVPRAPRDRGDTTRQLHSDPRVQAQASSLLKSAPARPRSPPAGLRSPPAGQDPHRPGPLDAGPAQIHMSPRLDPQTGRISRSRRRRPGPSTLPGHSIPFRLFEAAQPPQTGVAGSPQDRHARRNDDGNDAEQNEGGEKTQTQRKNKLGTQPRR